MITAAQKKALVAAGYTVKNQTVMNKSGGSVGGYNENGKIWSGSTKVRDILKSSPAPEKKADTKPATKPKEAPKKEAPVSKNALKGYEKGDIKTSKTDTKSGASRSTANKVEKTPPKKEVNKGAAAAVGAATMAALGVAGTKARKTNTPRPGAKGKPSNPTYNPKAKSPSGFQGKYQTGVGRPGAARAAGALESPGKKMLRVGGGGKLRLKKGDRELFLE